MAKQDHLDAATLAPGALRGGHRPGVRARAARTDRAAASRAGAGGLGRGAAAPVAADGRLSADPHRLRDVAQSWPGRRAPASDPDAEYTNVAEWTRRGEETCALVYGDNYRKLRDNVRELHPALDLWMITEGYGRTMARPGLDLLRRELCVVAQTAVLEAPRQLHSHLRGSLNAGATISRSRRCCRW